MINRQKIYEKLISSVMLSDEEFDALREAIKICSCEDECVGMDCPLNSVKAGNGVDCTTLFAQYAQILIECRLNIAFPTPSHIPESDPAKMVDRWLKEMKDIQIAIKREEPTNVITENVNGRVVYRCSNCDTRLRVSANTFYCDYCGQKLKFDSKR